MGDDNLDNGQGSKASVQTGKTPDGAATKGSVDAAQALGVHSKEGYEEARKGPHEANKPGG